MYNTQLKTILYEYANAHGLGMPLTAEQCLNAMSQWLTVTLPDCIDVVAVAADGDPWVTLTGNGTPDDHYVFTFGLVKGETGLQGEPGAPCYVSANIMDGNLLIDTNMPEEYSMSIDSEGDLILNVN